MIEGILETSLYVDNLDRSVEFYRDVMGFPLHHRQAGRHAFFRVGSGMLLLFLPEASSAADSELPPHGARGPGHVAFSVPGEQIEDCRAKLESRGVPMERMMDWPGGGRSYYFRDPAGNSLEIASPIIWR